MVVVPLVITPPIPAGGIQLQVIVAPGVVEERVTNVVEFPEQIGDVPEAEVAAVDKVLTIIVVLTHVVVLQVPAAKT